jgi:hypothetical protein
MAKAKKKGQANATFHIEDVFPLIRQKGDLIKVSMTCQFTEKTWNALGTLIGKQADANLIESDEQETGSVAEQGLPFEGEEEKD